MLTAAIHGRSLVAFCDSKRQDLTPRVVTPRVVVARRHNPVLKAFGDRLSETGLAPKAVVGAVMRKLAHLIYGVVTSGKPFDANFAHNKLAFQDGI